MQPSLLAAWKIYWGKVLTPQGRWLSLLQMALLSAQLLLPGRTLPGWFTELPSTAFQPAFAAMEAAMLGAFLVQWCAWSELLYGLRLRFQPADTLRGAAWRRFALHIYSGFVFLFVLSALANLQPLLGIGAMFLLFMSGEAQERKLAHKTIPLALLGGMGRSYRLISHEPWLFLKSLLLPGVVLYAGGVLVVWMRLVGTPWVLPIAAVVLWLGFFLLAQLKVALRAEAELDVDVLMGMESAADSRTPNPSRTMLKALLAQFNGLCNGLATLLGLAGGGWLLLKLGEAGLLSTHALAMAFGAMVGLLSGTVSALLSLLVRLGFISVVAAVIVMLLMLIIGFGRREPLKPLRQAADRLQQGIQRVAGAFSEVNLARGATLGLGTLLTALGTVAVQTYDRVQKDQARQSLVRETLQQQKKKEEDNAQARLERNEALLTRIQQRVSEIRKQTDADVRSELLQQLHSELRDVLPQFRLLNGATDGERKGKLLRYLYESGLLEPSARDACRKALSLAQQEMPTKEVKEDLKRRGCDIALFLHSMDFSGASLQDAYLKKAFLPFLNLQYANLRGAHLMDATFRYANFENADLSNTQLTGTDLSNTTLVGANLTGARTEGSPPLVNGAIAFYAVSEPAPDRTKGVISWDLVKGVTPGPRDPARTDSYWTFCPLDGQSESSLQRAMKSRQVEWGGGPVAQAGSKCRNRHFDAQADDTQPSQFEGRDWSGSTFRQSTLKGLSFRGITLAGADLSEATLEDMTLQDVSLAGANLQGATFKESALENVDFTGANLQGFRIDRPRHLHNILYLGSVIDLEENPSFTAHQTSHLRQKAYDNRRFSEQGIDDVAAFRQNVLLPLLMAPLPLRPQQLLYWMVATPQPAAMSSEAKAP